MNGTIGFFQELLSTSSQDESGGLGSSTLCKHIISLGTHLNFFKLSTSTQDRSIDIIDSGLNSGSCGLLNTLDVVISNTASTEDSTVGEILSGQVSNG